VRKIFFHIATPGKFHASWKMDGRSEDKGMIAAGQPREVVFDPPATSGELWIVNEHGVAVEPPIPLP
jgi:hypothetical protein